MSAKPRCHDCGHKRGPRSTSNMANADKKPYIHDVQPKKANCNHECHRR